MIEALRERLRSLREVELDEAQQLQFLDEEAALNVRRLKVILPAMILLNLGHLFLLHPDSPGYWELGPDYTAWAHALLVVHALTALGALLPLALTYLPKQPVSWVGPLGALVYQLHAAAVAGVDQMNSGTVAPYVGYALVNVVVVAMRPVQAMVVFGVSTLAFFAALQTFQPDEALRMVVRPTGPSVAVPAICIAWFLYAGRRQAFYFRETIARQRAELAELNSHLQERVNEQVAALVGRAEEVERLNEQLRARVQDRSKELAKALKRLAQHGEFASEVGGEGRVLAGRFELGKELGAGGMGVVHAATDLRSGSQVAVKLMRGMGAVSPAAVARFLREVETAASVTHPAIVRMIHVDVTADGTLFQVQERVEGYTLSTWLTRVEQLDTGVAVRALEVLCDALSTAHAAGVVHRDVKPANIMLTAEAPGLKLLDFGIAKAALSEQPAMTMTATGGFVGTPAYMAPELWDGSTDAAVASDVYAVGVTAVRILTGAIPRLGGGAEALAEVAVPDALRELVDRALHHDPAQRPCAAEIRDQCAAIAEAEGYQALDAAVSAGVLGVAREISDGTATHLSFG
ncbi:MAG: serine/threonine protein kinase [Deltaproteobacteria bacterium]|nr:MAG: serine/threonine protein kinase [Deltaproteobacteria bacterium]